MSFVSGMSLTAGISTGWGESSPQAEKITIDATIARKWCLWKIEVVYVMMLDVFRGYSHKANPNKTIRENQREFKLIIQAVTTVDFK